jgi:hypothetical protein
MPLSISRRAERRTQVGSLEEQELALLGVYIRLLLHKDVASSHESPKRVHTVLSRWVARARSGSEPAAALVKAARVLASAGTSMSADLRRVLISGVVPAPSSSMHTPTHPPPCPAAQAADRSQLAEA